MYTYIFVYVCMFVLAVCVATSYVCASTYVIGGMCFCVHVSEKTQLIVQIF